MIHVRVTRGSYGIEELQVKGHALSAVKGKDLVCAAVSAITQGGLVALQDESYPIDYTIEEGYINLHISGPHDKVQTIVETVLIQLQALAENQPKYLAIQTITH